MDLFCVILFCVGTSVTMATLNQRTPVEEDLTSSPLMQHLIDRVDALERQGAKQTSELQSLKTEMSHQASEIQSQREEMSQQASEIESLRAEMSQQASEIQNLRTEMSQQASEIESLRAEMSQQASEMQTMRAEMSHQAREIHTMRAEMSQQASEIQNLRAQMSQQATEIQSLRAEMSQQASEIQSQRAQMSQQASEIQSLRAEMSQQTSEIQTLRAEMSQQNGYMRQLRSKLHAKDKLIQSLLFEENKIINSHVVQTDSGETPAYSEMVPGAKGSKHRQQKSGLAKRIVHVENVPVAFFASLTQAFSYQPSVTGHRFNTPIVFDNVETNIGLSYHPMNGSFIVPVSGIYVFSANILSYASRNSHAYMKVNKDKKACILNGNYQMAGQTMVLQLNQGDNVDIETDYPDGLFHNFPSSYTTFSGFLLYQTYPDHKGAPLFG